MARNIQEISQNLNPPSKLKYFFFGFIAFFADIVDVAAALTGIGIVFSLIVDIVVAPILFFAGWNANSRIKAIRKSADNIHIHIEKLGRRIIQIRNIYARSLRLARKIPVLRKSVRKVALAIRSARLKMARNPLFKNVAAITADLVPYLDLMPWRTVAIYLTYRDEKKSYEEILENVDLALAAENQVIQYELDSQREMLAA